MAATTSVQPDLSLPISALLAAGTHAAHEKAEKSEGAGWLVRGELDKEEYVRFLMMLHEVYDAIERALNQHAAHPTLAPTHNPSLFARTESLAADISYLLQVPESSWKSHPTYIELTTSPPPALSNYVSRLQSIAGSEDPSPLLAHAYVRYLGDLSGGQFIKRRVAKAYGLEDGFGTTFYDFKPLGGTGTGTIGDMKKIKEWYREGMNAGVGDNQALKATLVEEANVAFELNTGLFSALRAPAPRPASEEKPSQVTEAVQVDRVSHEHIYKIASFLSFIAAISLAHVYLIFNGASGRGCPTRKIRQLAAA